MASKTATLTVDNLSMHAIAAPACCRKITLRERASDAQPVEYDIAAPSSTDAAFRKMEGESTVFDAAPYGYYDSGQIVGYIQPVTGTVVYTLICE